MQLACSNWSLFRLLPSWNPSTQIDVGEVASKEGEWKIL